MKSLMEVSLLCEGVVAWVEIGGVGEVSMCLW